MSRYGIVVDSGCDLKVLKQAEGLDVCFTRVPLTLQVGEKAFVDDVNLDIAGFMKEMSSYSGKTGSAAPSPDAWYRAYESADMIFAITITGSLSGSYNSAMTARNMMLENHPDKKICLIDSLSAGPGLTILAEKICDCLRQGYSFEETVKEVTEYQPTTHLLFILESLDNLVKNGRATRLQGSMASILGIRILGCASKEGTLEVIKKVRGKFGVYDKLVEEMKARGYDGGRVVIGHCFNEQKAAYLVDKIRAAYPSASVEIMPASGLCSYYAENQGVLLAFEE